MELKIWLKLFGGQIWGGSFLFMKLKNCTNVQDLDEGLQAAGMPNLKVPQGSP